MEAYNRYSVVELVAAIIAICLASVQLSCVTTTSVGYHFMGITLLLIGVAFVILCLISCCAASESEILGWKNLYCSMPLAAVVLALGIFMMAVSSQGGAKAVTGRSYVEYEVESYSKWMQNKINANWDNYYRKAVVKNKDFVCAQYDTDPAEYEIRADPAFQLGCCVAPRGCKLCSLSNQTSSQRSIKLEIGDDHCSDDCNRWNNDPNILCFDCQSCKAGFLQDVTKIWLSAGIDLIIMGFILLGVLITGFFG